MKITLQALDKAKELAGERLHLTRQRGLLATRAPMTLACAKVTFQGATMKEPVVVEIREHKQGEIGNAVLDCIVTNLDARIKRLDEKLADLGIEVEEAA